jgi:hypothetical protein
MRGTSLASIPSIPSTIPQKFSTFLKVSLSFKLQYKSFFLYRTEKLSIKDVAMSTFNLDQTENGMGQVSSHLPTVHPFFPLNLVNFPYSFHKINTSKNES